MGRLEGKVALITGTASGQGRAAARLFAAEGALVVGCDLNADGHAETVDLVRSEGGEMIGRAPIDLTDEGAVASWIDMAVQTHGAIDVLYNNAAAARHGSIEDLSLEDWRWTLEHDLTIVFLATKLAVPVFKHQGRGAIVNTASVAGMNITMPGRARGVLSHCVAKAGVLRLTEVLAIELAPYGVRVNSVSPGVIETPAIAKLLGRQDSDARALFAGLAVQNRVGQPEDIARAALFLASDEAEFITGANIAVDGGSTASGGAGRPDPLAEDAIRRAGEVTTAASQGTPATTT